MLRCLLCVVVASLYPVFTASEEGCDASAGLPPFYVVHKVQDRQIQVDGSGRESVWDDAPAGRFNLLERYAWFYCCSKRFSDQLQEHLRQGL